MQNLNAHVSGGSNVEQAEHPKQVAPLHTPGPWSVLPEGFAKRGPWAAPTVYATDDDLRYVAVCACADHMNFHSATDNLANARLISAAPDLLAALELLHNNLADYLRLNNMGGYDNHDMRMARDAVNKATATPQLYPREFAVMPNARPRSV